MKRYIKILCVMLAVVLSFQVAGAADIAANAATSTDIKTSDLFYGYSYYLNPQYNTAEEDQWVTDRYLDNALNTADAVRLEAASGLGDLYSSIIYSFQKGDFLFAELLAKFGLGDTLNDKCVDKATNLLLMASLQDKELITRTAQKNQDLVDGWESIKEGVDWLEENPLLSSEKVSWIKAALEAKSAIFDAVDETLITSTEMGNYIAFVESVNDEVLDYLIETVEVEDLKEGLIKHKSYKTSNYKTYIEENYLEEKIVEGVGTIFKKLSETAGVDTYFEIASAIFETCAVCLQEVTGLGSAEEVLVATKLYDYVTILDTERRELVGYFGSAPVFSEDVEKYEFCYNMYIAAVKSYVTAMKEVYEGYDTELDAERAKLDEYVTYENHLADCKAVVNSLPIGERRVDVNTSEELYYKLNDITYISASSDTMEDGTIYLCNDKLYYGIDAYADVFFKESETPLVCTIDGNFHSRSGSLYVPENVQVTIAGDYLGTYLDLWTKKTLNIAGTLIVNGAFQDQYLSATHINLMKNSSLLQLKGDVSVQGNWTIADGEVIFAGSNVSAVGLESIGETAVIIPVGTESVRFSKFALKKMPSSTTVLDMTITGGANGAYILAGKCEGYKVESSYPLLVNGSWIVDELAMEDTTMDVDGTVNAQTLSLHDAVLNIDGSVKVDEAYLGDCLDLKTRNTVNIFGTLEINGTFEDETQSYTTLNLQDQGVVVFGGTGTGKIAPSMFELERKSGYSPNLTLKADDVGFRVEKTDDLSDASVSAFSVAGQLVLSEGSYGFDHTEIKSTGVLHVNEDAVLQGSMQNTGTLNMTSGGNLCVMGDFSVNSTIDHSELLTAGVLEIKGDFTQNGTMDKNYNTKGTHITRLSGDNAQNVKFSYYRGNALNQLEILNDSKMGVVFQLPITMRGLFEHNQKAFSLYSSGSGSTFKDYDEDGVTDEKDSYPANPNVSGYVLTADNIETQTFTGEAVEPAVTVKDGAGKELVSGTDYSVSYINNTEPGTGTAKVMGLGKYNGKNVTLTFEIVCEHEYSEWETGEEKHSRVCEICSEREEVSHDLEWIVDLEPTETSTGLKHQKCKVCDYVCSENTIMEVLAHAHVMKFVEAKESTCAAEGNIAHYQCETCGKLYQDEAGTEELEEEAVVTGKKEHSPGEWQPGEEKHTRVCVNCSEQEEGNHEFEWVVDEQPTETTTGLKHKECPLCGYTCEENTIVDVLSHVHTMKEVPEKEATCTEEGNIAYYRCESCEELYLDENGLENITEEAVITDKKEHSPGEWQPGEEKHTRVCVNCSEAEEGDHEFEWIVDQEPTEAAEGVKHEECKICGFERNQNTNIEKLPHVHVMKYVEAKEATCTEDGNIAHYQCESCGKLYQDEAGTEEFAEEAVMIGQKGHSPGEWRPGEEEHTRVCVNCSEPEEGDHEFEWIVDQNPTEEAEGAKHEWCQTCGFERNKNTPIEKLPHVHVMKAVGAKAATCTVDGNSAHYKCTSCNKLYQDTTGKAELKASDVVLVKKGHQYASTTTKATLSKNGSTVTKCKVCGVQKSKTTIYYPKTIKLSATSYTYNGKVKNPTVKVTNSAGKTVDSKYYTVTYASGCKNAGEYKVTVTFKDLYSGTKSLKFTIKPNAKMSLAKTSYTYDGKAKKPSVVVKNTSGKTISSKYYTVSYSSGRKNVGTYTVKVKLKNGYSGTLAKSFTLKPKGTTIKKLTPASKKMTVSWTKLTTQTTGYQIQYSTSKSFTSSTTKTVTVSKNTTTSKTIKSLKGSKKYYVRIRTYKTVSGEKMYSSWSAVKTVTTKK